MSRTVAKNQEQS